MLKESPRPEVLRLQEQLGRVILGKPEVIDDLLVALLAGSHILMEDVPGVGKTTLAKALAKSTSSALADFLFRKREGGCEYFATAAAILLRTQGIPTRYVSGFNVIGSQRKGDYYLVRDWDRHAWIEAYIEGKGWIEYDPTPAAEYETLHAGESEGFWAAGVEWLSARFSILYVRLRFLDGKDLAPFLGLALAASAVARLLRHRRRGVPKKRLVETSKAPPTGLETLIAKLDQRVAELGYPRRQATAPLEHWNSVPEDRLSGATREAGVRILESFYRARFGGVPISPEEAKSLARALEVV